LYTAIIAGLVTAFFGSSEFNISGTNSVLAVAVGILVASQGASALLALCVLIGLFQLLFGFLKLGTLARFVPLPVLVGFSTGVAFQLFLLQLPKAFDASIGNPETFLEIFIALWQKMVVAGHYNFSAFLVAGLTIVLLV
jgi:SulP family sulfate permease